MKFFGLLFSGLALAATANAIDVDASTCNACSDAQKEERAKSGFRLNLQNDQYILDLVNGSVNKYYVVQNSNCVIAAPKPIKGRAHVAASSSCEPSVDQQVVEPGIARKGQSLSVLFLNFGELQAKIDINVAEIAAGNPTIAGMDAFDYSNNSSNRNDLHEMIASSLSNQVGNTIADALEDLIDTADRLLADGKAGKFYVTIKFADGSEVTRQVLDSHTSVLHGVPQDANNNDIPSSAEAADGQIYSFGHDPSDYSDWQSYMNQLGVTITNPGGGSALSCSSSIDSNGQVTVTCVAI